MEPFRPATLGLSEMKIQFTSMVEKSVPDFHLDVCNGLSDYLTQFLVGVDYGNIDQVTFIVVAFDEDMLESEARCARITKFSRVTHPFTKEKIRTLVLGLPFQALHLLKMSKDLMLTSYCSAAVKAIQTSGRVKIPKDVEYERLAAGLMKALTSADQKVFVDEG